jgi:CheY-like chemotaxis protein
MPSKIKRSLLPLLHIDDSPDDRSLIEQAIRSTNTPFEFHGVDGLDAATDFFAFLTQMDRPPGHPRPALVLLDYDLGAQCGTDFLYWLRTQHRNTAIPVVMYSGSAGHRHIADCYAQGADHFLRKAQSFSRIKAVVRTLHFCFCFPTPSFQLLARLPESEADPRLAEPAIA